MSFKPSRKRNTLSPRISSKQFTKIVMKTIDLQSQEKMIQELELKSCQVSFEATSEVRFPFSCSTRKTFNDSPVYQIGQSLSSHYVSWNRLAKARPQYSPNCTRSGILFQNQLSRKQKSQRKLSSCQCENPCFLLCFSFPLQNVWRHIVFIVEGSSYGREKIHEDLESKASSWHEEVYLQSHNKQPSTDLEQPSFWPNED